MDREIRPERQLASRRSADGRPREGLKFLRSLPAFISPFTLAIIAKVCGAEIERAGPRWVVLS